MLFSKINWWLIELSDKEARAEVEQQEAGARTPPLALQWMAAIMYGTVGYGSVWQSMAGIVYEFGSIRVWQCWLWQCMAEYGSYRVWV